MNIADILTRWTDGELRSTYHRVRSPDQASGEPSVRIQSSPYLAQLALNFPAALRALTFVAASVVACRKIPAHFYQKGSMWDGFAQIYIAVKSCNAPMELL